MTDFKELGIKPTITAFEGDKIEIERILNKSIVVDGFKIDKSKYPDKGNGQLLTVQIMVDERKRVLFTGSGTLMGMISAVPKDKFPFQTIIIKENKRYEFT